MSDGGTAFGTRLRQLRTATALSQEELAARSGLSRRGISDLERGVTQVPRLETVRMLADALALWEDDRMALLAAARPAVFRGVPPESARPAPVSLPVPLTRLIGREAEVHALCATVRHADVRWVTLTGAGGSGKTRLAIAVATELGVAFPDGVNFVDLSPLTDPALVVPMIAADLGVREVTGQPLLLTLSAFLAPKRVLLVLDNCERVLAVAPELTTLLAASLGLTVFATSRESFHVRGEREFPLLPLPLPAADQLPVVAELAEIPAITLFVERAQAGQPTFALSTENAATVASICRRLDGLPLAIELAAARIKHLPPTALLTRLEPRLPLLTGGGRDLPARQRTMRDAIAWSYDLLGPEEQLLFRHLAVFTGGFTLSSAEAVMVPHAHLTVLNGVGALIERSLLQQMASVDEDPRYQMLETVREFGLEQLEATGEEDAARRRHAEHFLQLTTNPPLAGPWLANPSNIERIAAEHENLLLALAWFDDRGEIDALLHLSDVLSGIWFVRGLYGEGLQRVEYAIQRSRRVPSIPLVRAFYNAALYAVHRGDYARAETSLTEGLALAREFGDLTLVGEALTNFAALFYRRRDFARAEELLDEAREALGGRDANEAGMVTFFTRGDLALAAEQFERAAQEYEEAIDRHRAEGDEWGLSDMLAGLAAVRYCTGELSAAVALYAESLQRSHARHYWPLLASSLLGLAGVAAATEQPEVGGRLLGAAEGHAAALGVPLFTKDLPVHDRAVTALTVALGEDQFAAAREAGHALALETAIAQATAVAEAVRVSFDIHRRPPRLVNTALT